MASCCVLQSTSSELQLKAQAGLHPQPIAVTVHAGDFGAGVSAAPGLKPELRKALDDFVSQNKIVLFMKGTQQVPRMCAVHVTSSMIQPPDTLFKWQPILTWGACPSSHNAGSQTPACRCVLLYPKIAIHVKVHSGTAT